jgi:hypothetical protein
MPVERAHGARIRRKAAAVNAFTPTKSPTPQPTPARAPEPEPEPEPEPPASRQPPPQPALSGTAKTRRAQPSGPRFSDQLIANLLGEVAGAAPAANGRRPLRPSLTDQLSRATSGADEVLAQFGDGRKAKGLIYTAPAERFAVAECVSRQASPMSFFDDRATYAFAHPLKGRVDMVMYYKDITEPRVARSHRLFTFRVKKTLRHFVDEYEPYNSAHQLSLCFKSMDGLEKFEQLVLERITTSSG